jgi:hypothetical protein
MYKLNIKGVRVVKYVLAAIDLSEHPLKNFLKKKHPLKLCSLCCSNSVIYELSTSACSSHFDKSAQESSLLCFVVTGAETLG